MGWRKCPQFVLKFSTLVFLNFALNLISEFPMRQVCRPNLMFGENYGAMPYKIGLTAANTENLVGRLILWRVQITFFYMGPSSDSDYSPDPLSQKSTVQFSSQLIQRAHECHMAITEAIWFTREAGELISKKTQDNRSDSRSAASGGFHLVRANPSWRMWALQLVRNWWDSESRGRKEINSVKRGSLG